MEVTQSPELICEMMKSFEAKLEALFSSHIEAKFDGLTNALDRLGKKVDSLHKDTITMSSFIKESNMLAAAATNHINYEALLGNKLDVIMKRWTEKSSRKTCEFFYGTDKIDTSKAMMTKIRTLSANKDQSMLDEMLNHLFPAHEYMNPSCVATMARPELHDVFSKLNHSSKASLRSYLGEHWLQRTISATTTTSSTSADQQHHSIQQHAYSLAIDTHAQNITIFPTTTTTSTPMTQNASHDDDPTYLYPGRPDYVSAVAPMWLEMETKTSFSQKRVDDSNGMTPNDYYCIHRALDRMHSTATSNDLLQLIVCFSTCGDNATLCYILKKDFSGKQLKDSLYIFPIHHNDIIPLWRTINKVALQNPQDIFRLNDTIMISRTLQNIFPSRFRDACNCSIRLVSRPSGSSVYQITFCSPAMSSSNSTTTHSMVIKLPHRRGLHYNMKEINVLKTIKDLPSTDFIIGIQEFDVVDELQLVEESPLELELEDKGYANLEAEYVVHQDRLQNPFLFFDCREQLAAAAIEKQLSDYFALPNNNNEGSDPFVCWWMRFASSKLQPVDYLQNLPATRFSTTTANNQQKIGAIVMYHGQRITKYINHRTTLAIYRHILQPIHQRNVYHTDIRPENLMTFEHIPTILQKQGIFPEEYCIRLIDFDHAVQFPPEQQAPFPICLHPGARQTSIFSLSRLPKDFVREIVNNTTTVGWNEDLEVDMMGMALDNLNNSMLPKIDEIDERMALEEQLTVF